MHVSLSCGAAFTLLVLRIVPYILVNGLVPRRTESSTRRSSMLLSLIRALRAFRDYQRNVAELSQLSDRELADIGLDRSDIPRVASGHYNG